jgi:hypothetical protein
MKHVTILLAAVAIAPGCGSQGEEPVRDAPAATTGEAEPACDDPGAAEEQCVCPDSYAGEPPCPHAGQGRPCDCQSCPPGCECKGGDRPCPRRITDKPAAGDGAPAS